MCVLHAKLEKLFDWVSVTHLWIKGWKSEWLSWAGDGKIHPSSPPPSAEWRSHYNVNSNTSCCHVLYMTKMDSGYTMLYFTEVSRLTVWLNRQRRGKECRRKDQQKQSSGAWQHQALLPPYRSAPDLRDLSDLIAVSDAHCCINCNMCTSSSQCDGTARVRAQRSRPGEALQPERNAFYCWGPFQTHYTYRSYKCFTNKKNLTDSFFFLSTNLILNLTRCKLTLLKFCILSQNGRYIRLRVFEYF